MYCRGCELLSTVRGGVYLGEDCLSVYEVGVAFLVVTRNRMLLLQRMDDHVLSLFDIRLDDCVDVYLECDERTGVHSLCVSSIGGVDVFSQQTVRKSSFALKMGVQKVSIGRSETALKICNKLSEIMKSELANHEYGTVHKGESCVVWRFHYSSSTVKNLH